MLVYRFLTIGSVEIDMMEKQMSKKKLERMAISGGNFAKPGQQVSGGESIMPSNMEMHMHMTQPSPHEINSLSFRIVWFPCAPIAPTLTQTYVL